MRLQVWVGFSLLLGGSACQPCEGPDRLEVDTTSGRLHGFVNTSTPNVRQFLGVPYAQPPLGDLRFQPPARYASSNDQDSHHWASNCMQTTTDANSLMFVDWGMAGFLIPNGTVSEDCLYLNVFAPATRTEKKLPVFVWIHGGGFVQGGSLVPYQIPDQWVQRSQAHIVVTINYRLNIFGFPNAASGTENVGLLDQRLAVEWVRDNIDAFGGDTSRIVLWGQSAGAFSVNYYALAYIDDPIVSGLISDSGSDSTITNDPTHGNFTSIAAKMGCDELSPEAELICLRDVDATELTYAVGNTTTATFSPQADNKTVFSDWADRISNGRIVKVPWIVGNNKDESSAGAGFSFVCETEKSIKPRLEAGITMYRYHYTGNFSNITPPPQLGAAHSSELPLIFGTHWQFHHNSTGFEYEVSAAMQGLWLSFAENLNQSPTVGDYFWPQYKQLKDTLAAFALDEMPVQDLDYEDAFQSLQC